MNLAADEAAPALSIVIPTYNRRDELAAATASLRQQSRGDFECLIVDNGPSDDGTDEMCKALTAEDPRFRYFQIGAIGIFPSCNHGLRQARGRILMTMDDDVEFTDTSTIDFIVDCFDDDPGMGLMQLSEYRPDGRLRGGGGSGDHSPRNYWRDTTMYPPGKVNRWGFIGTRQHLLRFGEMHEVDQVRSAAMPFRREAYEQVGGFHEPYVVLGRGYRCETDLCLRIKHAGWRVMFAARDPQVLHKAAPKTRGWRRGGGDANYIYATNRNNLYFFLRNFWSPWSAPIFFLWDVLVGGTQQPGAFRLLRQRQLSPWAWWITMKGKCAGLVHYYRAG